MFNREEQVEILKAIGYDVRQYSVDARMGGGNHYAIIHNHYGYEVFKNDKLVGNVETVFKQEVKKRLFNI